MKEQTASRVISLADEEAVKKVLPGSVMGLWGVVNDLMRLRIPRRRASAAIRQR